MSAIKAAVIGHPIKHSKSPLIHNHWIKTLGLEGSYEAIDIAPEGLGDGLKRLIDEGYSGFNLTLPHKELALDLCDEIDHVGEVIGAVNTLSVRDGKLYGMNTDSYGFLTNIQKAKPDFKIDLGAAVVIGAGGAARAVVSGLMGSMVPEIIVVNRTREKAEALRADMDMQTGVIKVVDWEERDQAMKLCNLLVNTTSLGMDGQPELELDFEHLPSYTLVNDIVYAPLMTPLLRAAEERGNDIVSGIGMLLYQAQPAFREWFGVMPEVDEALEKLVLA